MISIPWTRNPKWWFHLDAAGRCDDRACPRRECARTSAERGPLASSEDRASATSIRAQTTARHVRASALRELPSIHRESSVYLFQNIFSSPLSFILSTWQFSFVLFVFVLWPHWRWSVYFQYGRLFTVSTCWILIYLYRSSWFMRRWDRQLHFTDRRSQRFVTICFYVGRRGLIAALLFKMIGRV